MGRTTRGALALGLAAVTLGAMGVAAAAPPAGDESESFTFVILGEREPGPGAPGAAVAEKGARIASWLNADLVVTLASEPDSFSLDELRVPWHAPPSNAPGASFDHKWAHFVLLGADAAGVNAGTADWLGADLASTRAVMVYLFVREPLWRQGADENGWGAVEAVLAADGRPVSVFAGKDRYVRDDGRRGRVRYRSVGPTGAYTNLDYEGASFQHVTHVNVRRDGESVTLIPIEETRSPTEFVGAEFEALDRFRESDWARLEGGVRIGVDAGAESDLTIELVGQAEIPLEFAASIDADEGWTFSQSDFRGHLDPGQRVSLPVRATAPALGRSRPEVTLTVRAQYPLNFGADQAVTRRLQAPVEVVGLGPEAGKDGALVLNGRSALRVDLEDRPGPFTIEFWAKGREPQAGRAMGVVTQGDAGGFGFYWSDGSDGNSVLPVGVVRTTGGLVETRAGRAWAWGEWTHIALCFDGRESRLYVGGRLSSRASAPGAPAWDPAPLYIGSGVNAAGGPDDYFHGRLDDLRLSDIARYDADFTPPDHPEADEHTRLLLRFDARTGGVFPDASGSGAHGWGLGSPSIQARDR